MDFNPATQGQPLPQAPSTPNPPPNDGAKWALDRLLDTMAPELAQSFNEEQRLALQAALVCRTRKRHPIDLRWSIPVLRRRFYLVLLMGEEERSKARRRQPRNRDGGR